MLMASSYIG